MADRSGLCGRRWTIAIPVAALASSAVVWTAAPSGAAAVVVDCGPPRTVVAVADAWLDESSPSTNKGSDSILKVRSQGPNGNFRALVRFPAADPAPDGCVLQTARLRLYAASPGEDRVLQALPLASAWTELSVTWANQPASTGPASTIGSGSEQGYREWRVTAAVAAGAPYGFLVMDGAENDSGEQSFHAREKGEHPPELVVRYAPPPDPSQGQLPPEPAEVACGQEVVASTLVTNDLTNCPGDGLVIGAPHIIVDLDGHTLDGVGLGVGVRNDGFEEVTVRNGPVTDFDYGVQLNAGTTRGLVERLTLTANQVAAVELVDADGPAGGNDIRSNTLQGNGLGISLTGGTSGASVTDNTVLENAGEGVVINASDGNAVDGNQFTGGSDRAIELFAASDNVLRGNSVTGSGDGGIDLVAGSHRNLVQDNVLTRTGDSGLFVGESDANRLIGNTAHEMSDNGITLSAANDSIVQGNDLRFNAVGMELSDSSRNVVEGNLASESLGNGIELGGGSFANTVRENVADGGGGDGIVLADDALVADQAEPGVDHANLVTGNTASENQGDGIEAAKGGHVLTGNVTNGNGGWGIFAQLGTRDGGGNVAKGNGEAAQCLGIVCVGQLPPVDTVPPETEISSGPPLETEETTARFVFQGADETTGPDGLGFECALDDGAWVACSSPVEYTDLAVGDHRLGVRAVDAAGNTDPTPATHTWTVLEPPPPDCGPTITVSADADAWVDRSNPRRNYGTSSSLRVRDSRSVDYYRSLVRFALAADPPTGCEVGSATLRMYAGTWSQNRTLSAAPVSSAWSERTVTWANQPASSGAVSLARSGAAWREWSVTEQVQTMYEGANHGFLISDVTPSGSGEQRLHSRERSSNRPHLVVTFVPTAD